MASINIYRFLQAVVHEKNKRHQGAPHYLHFSSSISTSHTEAKEKKTEKKNEWRKRVETLPHTIIVV